jgi:hydrogenase maturation protease
VKPVIVGLGNDLFADDGFGLVAARRCAQIVGSAADVIESQEAGLALLDPLVGRPLAVVLDAVCTGRDRPGTVYLMKSSDLRVIPSLSPHHAGLPEVLQMAGRLQLPVPRDVHIIAVEAEDLSTMGRGLTAPVERAVNEAVAAAVDILRQWQQAPIAADAVPAASQGARSGPRLCMS